MGSDSVASQKVIPEAQHYEAQEKDRIRWEQDIELTRRQAWSVETTVRFGVKAPHLRRIAKKVAKDDELIHAREISYRQSPKSVRKVNNGWFGWRKNLVE